MYDTHASYRESSQKYVRAAFAASGLTRQDFARKCGIHSDKSIKDYLNGSNCPNVERLIAMYNFTGIVPDDYGMPLLEALDCVDQMRDMFTKGRAISEFAKATRLNHRIIGRLIDGESVTLMSVMKFRAGWMNEPIPERSDEQVAGTSKELRWINAMWKTLAKTAQEIRKGLWIWYSDSLFRMELEHIADDRYIFRSIERETEKIFTIREVQI